MKNNNSVIKSNEDRYYNDLLFKHVDFIWQVDKNGVFTFAKGKVEEILGYKPEEIIGKTPFDFMPPEEAQRVSRLFTNILKYRKDIKELENWNLTKSGEPVCLLTSGTPIYDKDNNFIGYQGVDKDITKRVKYKEKLIYNNLVLSSVINATSDLIFYKDYLNDSGKYIGCNEAFAKFVGKTIDEIAGKDDIELFGEKMGRFFRIKDAEALKAKQTKVNEEWVDSADGKKLFLRTSKIPFLNKRGETIGLVGISRDITEYAKATASLSSLGRIIDNSLNEIYIFDKQTLKFTYVNQAVSDNLGYSLEEMLKFRAFEIKPKFTEKSFKKAIKPLLEGKKEKIVFETYHKRKDETLYPVEVHLQLISNENQEQFVAIILDRTEHKKAEKELLKQKDILIHQAHYDLLTDLPNRLLFNDRLNQAIVKAKRHKNKFALFFIDLDRFKHINDSLGHETGDHVLQIVSNRLKSIIRDEDTLSRLGGDEFTILAENIHTTDDVTYLAQKVLNILKQPIHIQQNTFYISSSIGISLYPEDDMDAQNLLKYADAAMYKAKEEGRNNFQFYSSEMTEQAVEHIAMEANLRQALDREEFVVYYQPQIDARTHNLIGMEALVRWSHPTEGLISPAKFIPIAEKTGLIVQLDRLVMKIAMRQFAKWYKQGFKPGVLALNLAMKQLRQKDFVSVLMKNLKKEGCEASWLELEVTESQIMLNPKEAIATLNEISDMGVELAIDDFGTGYSSLSYLKRLPIDKLKIDQSFIRELPNDEEEAGITRAVIAISKSLNLNVIAEGVETQEQVDFLLENGCNNIQGYFYAKPMPAKELEEKFL